MRLYQKGAGEQEIMSVTGHRSKDGLRAYKRMSVKQEEELSDMLQSGEKKNVLRLIMTKKIFRLLRSRTAEL